jgi:Na+/melibiose symporter-like transporter
MLFVLNANVRKYYKTNVYHVRAYIYILLSLFLLHFPSNITIVYYSLMLNTIILRLIYFLTWVTSQLAF